MWFWLGLLLATVATLAASVLILRYFSLWLRAYVTGTRISMLSLMLMSLRKVSPRVIVDCKVMAVQAGLDRHSIRAMEAHYLAGGDVEKVTHALIIAHRAHLDLDWNSAAAIDLAGRDVLEAVQTSVSPRVIDCPDAADTHRKTLDGVAQDGIQLRVRVRVTVRTNLRQLIGGATEATVIARIGQGIISAIGACDNYRVVLSNPMLITAEVLKHHLDAQTAYSIVSIDIADITVGRNVGAHLQLQQAEADMRIAMAAAEKRRAMALARLQEFVALERANEALVVLAEAQIPAAMADAYRDGQFTVQTAPERSLPVRSSPPANGSRRRLNAWVTR